MSQSDIWAGDFGTDYTRRNAGSSDQQRQIAVQFWYDIVMELDECVEKRKEIKSVIEYGANTGLNLSVLKTLLPGIHTTGWEVNPVAMSELRQHADTAIQADFLVYRPGEPEGIAYADLVFTKGVLIHVHPDDIERAYDILYETSKRFILVAEYYNPNPVAVKYRGRYDLLWKRDFAGEMLDRHPDLRLRAHDFYYRRDERCPQDDLTYFLMEKIK